MTTVALDCMGGDFGPQEAVLGAAALSMERQDLSVILVGDAEAIASSLADASYEPARLSIHHCSQWVDPSESPAQALAAKPEASVAVACGLVASGRADAVVTGGSTGAAILAASKRLGRIEGVRRAALAAVTATEGKRGPKDDPFALMVDVGATLNASASDLVAFALMGSAYAAAVSGNPQPRVALLSNGTEAHKGPPEVVKAHELLQSVPGLHFVGNIEGLDIPRGTVDVVVMSGFVGNVVLKMLEGFGEVISDLSTDDYARRFVSKLGLSRVSRGLEQMGAALDWKSYGGAPILGFAQPVIKAHGRSQRGALANACRVAAKAVRGDMVSTVRDGLAVVPSPSSRGETP